MLRTQSWARGISRAWYCQVPLPSIRRKPLRREAPCLKLLPEQCAVKHAVAVAVRFTL